MTDTQDTSPPTPKGDRPGQTRKDRRFILGLVCLGLAIPLAVWVTYKEQLEEAPVVYYRVATFNASLFRPAAGDLASELEGGGCGQAQRVAAIVQRIQPHILLLNEFDHDPGGRALRIFQEQYLEVSQGGAEPIRYRSSFTAPVNTGVPSGMDLDQDGSADGPGDALGYGTHPGQYGMAVLTSGLILTDEVRTFRKLKWSEMPDNRMPTEWYDASAQAVLPLSSKSHWDIPIILAQGARPLHLLASHPTPPGFDGPEDRNGRRNADEIRLWADYVAADPARSAWILDDKGTPGGLPGDMGPDGQPVPALFIIAGDLNADPTDGDDPSAIAQLLQHPRVQDPQPRSGGGAAAAMAQWGANSQHKGDHQLDTGDFTDRPKADGTPSPGNLRVDYVLPCGELKVLDAAVFWPAEGEPAAELLGTQKEPTSDHRLVFVDIAEDSLMP